MDKRYQVFISSTFADLKDERQAVLRAILELDHMPAGMELFPAADDSAWQLIQDVIDGSDYYVLIVGGRYGSLDEAGLGYTEKEYDYALSVKKPVIPLLHGDPNTLPREKTETEEAAWKKLQSFRAKVEKKHTCVYWKGADELKARVIVGLTSTVKRHPAVGWVRADQVPLEATVTELLALKNRIAELEAESAASVEHPPAGSEELAHGDDTFEVNTSFKARKKVPGYPGYEDTGYTAKITPSWNEIFAAVAPCMIHEAANGPLRSAFRECFENHARATYEGRKEFKDQQLRAFEFHDEEIETCIVQLRALGLMRESVRKRSLRDAGTYWNLTPYGNNLMVQLRAIRREPPQPSASSEENEVVLSKGSKNRTKG
jgi:hypothetical protein